jgi:galactonate dehydratase
VKLGFTGIKFDPAAPYSVFDPRQPSLEIDGAVREVRAAHPRGGRHRRPIYSSARMASSRRRAPSALPSAWRPYQPLWFEEPTPPEMPEEMALVARGTSIPIATGERLDDQIRIRPRAGAARGVHPADAGRPRRRHAGSQKDHDDGRSAITPRSRRISTAGPVDRHGQCPARRRRAPISSSWKASRPGAASMPRSSRSRCRWEAGYVIPPTEPGLGIELDEDVARRTLIRARTCIWR